MKRIIYFLPLENNSDKYSDVPGSEEVIQVSKWFLYIVLAVVSPFLAFFEKLVFVDNVEEDHIIRSWERKIV